MSEEIFTQNLVAFRKYAVSQGLYFNENGCLVFNHVVITCNDSRHLAKIEVASQRLLNEKELKDALLNLFFYNEEEDD